MRAKVTGNRRYRVENRLFREPLVVLQIELEGFVPEFSGGQVDGEIRRWFIDAKPEDVMIEQTLNAKG